MAEVREQKDSNPRPEEEEVIEEIEEKEDEKDGIEAKKEEQVEEEKATLVFLDSLDNYLVLLDFLSSTLRQGWLDLASARYSMGPSRVSSTLFDHKEQSAATKLQITESTDILLSEPNFQFALSKWGVQDAKNHLEVGSMKDKGTESNVRHRGSPNVPDDSSETNSTSSGSHISADNDVLRERAKSLSMFGTLVSPKLRTAQFSFEKALDVIVEIANSRSSMLSSFSQLQQSSDAQVQS